MNKEYKGIIIEESLEDNRILNDFNVVDVQITNENNPNERWHLYKVKVSKEEIEKLSNLIKSGKWYMHFWKDNKDIIAVFRNKIFEFNYDDKSSWKSAVEYGLSVDMPKEQLDFLID